MDDQHPVFSKRLTLEMESIINHHSQMTDFISAVNQTYNYFIRDKETPEIEKYRSSMESLLMIPGVQERYNLFIEGDSMEATATKVESINRFFRDNGWVNFTTYFKKLDEMLSDLIKILEESQSSLKTAVTKIDEKADYSIVLQSCFIDKKMIDKSFIMNGLIKEMGEFFHLLKKYDDDFKQMSGKTSTETADSITVKFGRILEEGSLYKTYRTIKTSEGKQAATVKGSDFKVIITDLLVSTETIVTLIKQTTPIYPSVSQRFKNVDEEEIGLQQKKHLMRAVYAKTSVFGSALTNLLNDCKHSLTNKG